MKATQKESTPAHKASKPSNPKNKQRISKKKRLAIIIGASVLLAVLICFSVWAIIRNNQAANEKAQEGQLELSLKNCIKNANSSLDALLNGNPDTENYEAEIECYEKYNVPGYLDKIAELQEKLTGQKMATCLEKARADYAATDEEIANVNTIAEAIKILQRYNAGYNAQINCYQEHRVGDYESEINTLNQKIAENNSLINSASSYATSGYIPTGIIEQQTKDYTASNNYNIPATEEPIYTTPTPTCDEYRNQYYTNYQNEVAQTQAYYNNAISNASMQCGAHGGCPAVTNLKNQLESELSQLQSAYESNLASVGCAP